MDAGKTTTHERSPHQQHVQRRFSYNVITTKGCLFYVNFTIVIHIPQLSLPSWYTEMFFFGPTYSVWRSKLRFLYDSSGYGRLTCTYDLVSFSSATARKEGVEGIRGLGDFCFSLPVCVHT
jgi:hypothetical protein